MKKKVTLKSEYYYVDEGDRDHDFYVPRDTVKRFHFSQNCNFEVRVPKQEKNTRNVITYDGNKYRVTNIGDGMSYYEQDFGNPGFTVEHSDMNQLIEDLVRAKGVSIYLFDKIKDIL